ncbi:MAG: hypothetical protein FWF24_01365 [Alphaproteobacteria bacterium]|nr:hypothetical protein [Alphaproteobacteria bacterium]
MNEPAIKKFGLLKGEDYAPAIKAMEHPDTFYKALFDKQALWDPATIDRVLQSFPQGLIDETDLFLILAECIANAVLHGQAEILGFHARKRGSVLLLSFYQIPAMQMRVGIVLSLARAGQIRECTAEIPGGLGFPILLRLVDKITISNDYKRLQLWMQEKSAKTA